MSLPALIDAARAAYAAHAEGEGRRSTQEIFALLEALPESRADMAERLPACAHLPAPETVPTGVLRDLMRTFHALEPHLPWRKRSGDHDGANAAYWDGHANAMIVGPGGLVPHKEVWLGVSLLTPGVRYPDHTHPPEETYLVLSDGEFYQEGRGWFTPGMGGSFYNPPGIVHAMRSGETPLFAMWALKV